MEGAASVAPTPNTAKPTTAVNVKEDESEAKAKLKIDSSQPTTTLQIRLADGSRLTAQFNLNHTVADIHRYIMK